MADDLRARVKSEREGRNWSIREAATAGEQIISNTTWGTFEAGGPVTRKVRSAIARAFGWSTDWPENPPPPTPPAVVEPGMDGATMLAIVRRLDDVVQRLEALADRQASPVDKPAPRARRQPAATSRRKARTL